MTKIVTPDDNPFGQNNSIVDTRGSILMDHVDVVMIEQPSDGQRVVGLQLSGRVNRSSARTQVLYMFDEDGAAAIVTELVGLFGRAGDNERLEFMRLVDERLDALPREER